MRISIQDVEILSGTEKAFRSLPKMEHCGRLLHARAYITATADLQRRCLADTQAGKSSLDADCLNSSSTVRRSLDRWIARVATAVSVEEVFETAP